MYNLVSVDKPAVTSTSIDCQFIFSTVEKVFLGGTILVINALSSLRNASLLNPSDSSALEPKLELELVIDKSPPEVDLKWWAYPIANTETNCITELLDPFTW